MRASFPDIPLISRYPTHFPFHMREIYTDLGQCLGGEYRGDLGRELGGIECRVMSLQLFVMSTVLCIIFGGWFSIIFGGWFCV